VTKELPHISVCICTFRRAELLGRLLEGLRGQETGGLFTYSIVVVDNDELRSAEIVVMNFAASSGIAVKYSVEPRQNIALARNRAVADSVGDFVAFLDDDEFTTNIWLLTLFTACNKYEADGALGPVKPHFDEEPPRWLVRGKFYDRPSYPTGLVIDGKKGRTGNVLLKRNLFAAAGDEPFRSQFRTGEDQDFFTRMIDLKYKFVWCDEALAYEVVPRNRWKRSFMLRRALLRGGTSVFRRSFGPSDVLKSFVAVAIYALVLPFSLLLGHHRFMGLLISLFDHLGKLLALPNWNPVREPYVTE
jgi:succinoglycan biosynthesis protein ExoM